MKSLFGKKSSEPALRGADAPLVSVDARLPEPAVLTCNQDIPLSIILKRLNSSSDPVYLQSLQVALNANTKVRAHDVFRTEQNSWIIMSKSNMGMLIGSKADPEGTEVAIDDSLWRGQVLPNTVAPSFETCNIARSYFLDVRVGLSCSGPAHGGKVSKSHQTVSVACSFLLLQSFLLTIYEAAKYRTTLAPRDTSVLWYRSTTRSPGAYGRSSCRRQTTDPTTSPSALGDGRKAQDRRTYLICGRPKHSSTVITCARHGSSSSSKTRSTSWTSTSRLRRSAAQLRRCDRGRYWTSQCTTTGLRTALNR